MGSHYTQMLKKCFNPDVTFEHFRNIYTAKVSHPFTRHYITTVKVDQLCIEVHPEQDTQQCFEVKLQKLNVDLRRNKTTNDQTCTIQSLEVALVTKQQFKD